MGKLNKLSDSDNEDRMDIQKPQVPAKRKMIKKKAQKPIAQTQDKTSSSSKLKSQSLANKSVKKYAKMVNLHKNPVDLAQKQNLFKKVVQDTKGSKKVSRKERKKQRVIIKKTLRKQLDQKLPVAVAPTSSTVQSMQQQKSTVRKQKFEEKKVVQQFKKNMGLKFSGLKQILARKAN